MSTSYTKSYYKIREVSELLGIPQSTLRYWENEFPELNPRRGLSNQRSYTSSDLEILEIIRFLLKDKGMKIESAREQLRHNKKNISKKLEILRRLEKVDEDLRTLLHSLNLRYEKLK